MKADSYFLGHSDSEQHRLQRQAGELARESSFLFDQIGIAGGSRVVEIGCGPQGCLDLLSNCVGPMGSVVGIDVSDQTVQMARNFIKERGIENVEVRQGDAAATGLPRNGFDLAHARLVLVNVPGPERIVQEMAALVKSGGVVALHEVDWVSYVCDPPLAAWDQLKDLLTRYSASKGMDLFVGRRIGRMLREAGLVDVRVRPYIQLYEHGAHWRSVFLQFAGNLRERVLAEGLISEAGFAECVALVERHLNDPESLVLSHVFVQAWGRKP